MAVPERTRAVLEIHRLRRADDPFAFVLEPERYLVRQPSGSVCEVGFGWNAELLQDLAAITSIGSSDAAARRWGRALQTFLSSSEALQTAGAAVENGEPCELTIRLSAAELCAVPWELLVLPNTGTCLGASPAVRISYEWAGVGASAPSMPVRIPRRILFAWSSAGGDVAADAHIEELRAALGDDGPRVDVVGGRSAPDLAGLLDAARADGAPYDAVHLLAHGTATDDGVGLHWNGTGALTGPRLAESLRAHADTVRLLVISACHGGQTPDAATQLGSVAWHAHRAGIQAVLACRSALSVPGSVALTGSIHRSFHGEVAGLATAWATTRDTLLRLDTMDWVQTILMTAWTDDVDAAEVLRDLTDSDAAPGPGVLEPLTGLFGSGMDRASDMEPRQVARYAALVCLAFLRALASGSASPLTLPEIRRLVDVVVVDMPGSSESIGAAIARDSPLNSSTYRVLQDAVTDPRAKRHIETGFVYHFDMLHQSPAAEDVRRARAALRLRDQRTTHDVIARAATSEPASKESPAVERVQQWLAEEPAGPLCVAGTSGSGKTALARELASLFAARWSDTDAGSADRWFPISVSSHEDLPPPVQIAAATADPRDLLQRIRRRAWRRIQDSSQSQRLAGQRYVWIFDAIDRWSLDGEELRSLWAFLSECTGPLDRFVTLAHPSVLRQGMLPVPAMHLDAAPPEAHEATACESTVLMLARGGTSAHEQVDQAERAVRMALRAEGIRVPIGPHGMLMMMERTAWVAHGRDRIEPEHAAQVVRPLGLSGPRANRVAQAILVCLQWTPSGRALWGIDALRHHLVARYWSSELSRAIGGEPAPEPALARLAINRLRREPDEPFERLIAMVHEASSSTWTLRRRRDLAVWSGRMFSDPPSVPDASNLRESALAIRCALSDLPPFLVTELDLRSLLSWFWTAQKDSRIVLRRCHLSEFSLEAASLPGADLADCILERARLSRAQLAFAILDRAEMTAALLSGASLPWATLRNANLQRANLERADLSGAVLQGATLMDADLSGARMTYCLLDGADLSRASLIGVEATQASLVGARLQNATLHEAKLAHADLTGADLRGADFTGADLSGAVFADANLEQAVWTGATTAGAVGLDVS